MPAELMIADREKRWVALTSLWAAVGLTSFKIVVGLWTGSLGILAEAAHSGLDLVAAAVTFLAIRAAAKPPDREHLYGHGKVENLSAMFETVLLLVTCAWIFYEAAHRLMYHTGKVEVNAWSFAVMVTSIVIDFSRSRALARIAKKHNSQALEADALHFSTDIWSSLAVIAGLICVTIGKSVPRVEWLKYSDSVAAIMVALIVVYVSMELGMRTIRALLDTAPRGMAQDIVAAVEKLPGIIDCHNVRLRVSGPLLFVDVHVSVDGQQRLANVHDLMDRVEKVIGELAPGADVTVHPEPMEVPAAGGTPAHPPPTTTTRAT